MGQEEEADNQSTLTCCGYFTDELYCFAVTNHKFSCIAIRISMHLVLSPASLFCPLHHCIVARTTRVVPLVPLNIGGENHKQADDVSARKKGSPPPATIVISPDLLPPEDVPSRSSSAAGNAKPEAIWGAADAIRAVVIPLDMSSPVHGVETLDLAVASAAIAAAAAEEAANLDLLDRYPPIDPASIVQDFHTKGVNGEVNGSSIKVGGFSSSATMENGMGPDRRSLIVEAAAALLGCGRESIIGLELEAHGFDLLFNRDATVQPVPSSSVKGGGVDGSGAGGVERNGSGDPVMEASTLNVRASFLAGRRVVGDAVIVLVDGGMEHGAAGSGDLEGDSEMLPGAGIGRCCCCVFAWSSLLHVAALL